MVFNVLDVPIVYQSSDELIILLKNHITQENKDEIHELIARIYQLKNGVDTSRQKLLTDFL